MIKFFLVLHNGVVFNDVPEIPIGMQSENCLNGRLANLWIFVRTKLEKEVEKVQLFRWTTLHQIFHQVDDCHCAAVNLEMNEIL